MMQFLIKRMIKVIMSKVVGRIKYTDSLINAMHCLLNERLGFFFLDCNFPQSSSSSSDKCLTDLVDALE